MSALKIRPETQQDRSRIASLIARTYLQDGVHTIEVTGNLRDLDIYNNKLALVGESEEGIKTFALYTPVSIGDAKNAAVFLAPLAFDTKDENVQVIDFLRATFDAVKQQGYRYILMHGQAAQFEKDGFVAAKTLDIIDPESPAGIELLVKDTGTGSAVSGAVVYPSCLKS